MQMAPFQGHFICTCQNWNCFSFKVTCILQNRKRLSDINRRARTLVRRYWKDAELIPCIVYFLRNVPGC